jgi:hypothetical protein
VQQLFQAQGDCNVMQMVEVPDNAGEFVGNVVAQGGSDGYLVTADLNLHDNLLK